MSGPAASRATASSATMLGAVPFAGAAVTFGGRDWVVPPLTLGRIQRLAPAFQTINDGTGDQLGAVVAVLHAALSRNYPELTPDALADLIEIPDVERLTRVVLEVSGLVQAPAGEAASGHASGNA